MKNKIVGFILVIIVMLPIAKVIASIIDKVLKNSDKDILEYVLYEFNMQIFTISICFICIILLFYYYLTCIKKSNIYQSDLNYVTSKIKTPIAVGQGQYGTARWLGSREFKVNFKSNTLMKNDNETRFDNAGLVVGYNKENVSKEKIYYIDSNTHSLIVGATRSGKTRTVVLQTIAHLGLGEENIIISDPKGELYQYTSNYMKELEYEVIVIDFKNPLKSNSYNFLQPVIDAVNKEDYIKAEEYAWDITSALVGSEDSKMEKIWKDGEMSVIAGTIMAVVYENKDNPQYQNLTNVYTFISEMCRTEYGDMPINEYINKLDESNPASRIYNIARIAPDKTRGSFFTSALTTLKLFTSNSIYTMTSSSDFSLTDTGNVKRAIYVILPDERLTYYSLASLFINQQYVSLVENADSRGGELRRRVNFVLDEFGNFTNITGFGNMLTVGGGRKIRFNIFLQSFSQLDQKYGKEDAQNILDNCQTWLYLKTANFETASVISKKLGNYTTQSYSQSSSNTQSNSDSMSLIARPLLTEDEVMRIERPYILVINAGNYPAIVKMPDLSKWEFNNLLGLGNEVHNRKVREERENSRETKEIKKLELWKIWEDYR